MRHTIRGIAAVVLVILISLPAAAAPRSVSPGSLLQAFKRFVIRAASRISPPVGNPAVPPPPVEEEPVTAPTTQTQ